MRVYLVLTLILLTVKVSVMQSKILNYFHIVHCCHYRLINLIDDSMF